MKRIGLTQRVEFVEHYEERRDALDQNWSQLLEMSSLVPIPLSNTVRVPTPYLQALQLDGVILTGGNDLSRYADGGVTAPERDHFEKVVLDYCLTRDVPVLGVCRGMQLINDYFGGTLTAVTGHVGDRHSVQFVNDVLPLWRGSREVNSYHNFAISSDGLAGDLVVAATAHDGTVEACVHHDRACYGIMWHPERERPFASGDAAALEMILRSERT